MCIITPLQQKIINRTDEGDTIAAFLVDTMRGKTPGVKVCHRMDAAKHLIRYGFPDAECDAATIHPESVEGRAKAPSPSTGEGWDGGDESLPSLSVSITHLDIINYQIAHLIRHETAEGHTLVEFLIHIMTGSDRPFTPKKFRIKPADRIAAARELLRRGFGDIGPRRKLADTNDEANTYDTLHTDLANRMREYSERGTDTVRFLLEVMSDPDPDLEFTIHHRMSAAQELLRRGLGHQLRQHQAQAPPGLLASQGILAPLHRPEEDPIRFHNLHRRLRQLRRHRLRSHRQRDERRRRPRRQLKAASFPRDRPIFSPFLRKQESRRPPSRHSYHKAPSPSGRRACPRLRVPSPSTGEG